MNSTMAATTTVAKSVLQKPLHQITEDDISQLTREDCRRYLKDKGMRRPSWNKSQAIQQVISLKSLLEPSPPNNNSFSASLKSAVLRPPQIPSNYTGNSNSSELSPTEADGSVSVSVSAIGEDGTPNHVAATSSSEPVTIGEGECPPTLVESKPSSFRNTDTSHPPFDQMTIFYSGRVNVYDGVLVDKARAIMHLAASPIQYSQDEQNTGNSSRWSSPCQLPTSSRKYNVSTQDGSAAQSTDVEGQTSRQVSLQRYFEKRKDRGKYKMKRKIGSAPSSLEMYLNQQMRSPDSNGQTTRNNTCLITQLGIPCSSYGLVNKEQNNLGLSVDLDDKV